MMGLLMSFIDEMQREMDREVEQREVSLQQIINKLSVMHLIKMKESLKMLDNSIERVKHSP